MKTAVSVLLACLWAAATLPAQKILYTYDQAGRLTKLDYGNGNVINLTYDAAGNIIRRNQTTSATFAVVSNASYAAARPVPPESIVSGFGQGLAAGTVVVDQPQLEVGGARVEVTDSLGVTRSARIYGVSQGLINFIVPAGTASGTATVRVPTAPGSPSGPMLIRSYAPSIYTVNQTGSGVAAAVALLVLPDGSRQTPLIFDPNTLQPVPMVVNGPNQVYLLMFATGIRGFTGEVRARINGTPVPVLGHAAQSVFAGLDQINIGPLPASLAGAGLATIDIFAGDTAANRTQVLIQ